MKDTIKYVAFSSFIKGIGSLLDMSPITVNEKINELSFRNDTEALRDDWENIGKDLSNSITRYGDSIRRTNIENSRG